MPASDAGTPAASSKGLGVRRDGDRLAVPPRLVDEALRQRLRRQCRPHTCRHEHGIVDDRWRVGRGAIDLHRPAAGGDRAGARPDGFRHQFGGGQRLEHGLNLTGINAVGQPARRPCGL